MESIQAFGEFTKSFFTAFKKLIFVKELIFLLF